MSDLNLDFDTESKKINLDGDVNTETPITIDRPNNLLAPRSERHSADGKSIQAEFDRLNASLTHDYRSSRSSRKSAANLSFIVESALSEVLAETSSGV